MLKPAIPPDEAQRIATLKGLNILDTSSEERFDRITRIAQHIFGVPIALISLVDVNRQWFKSSQGVDVTETPRDISFCGHAILGNEAFVVADAQIDPRFADNPLATGVPHIRFYAGQPLKANNGSKLGTLCIIDHQPRQLSQADLSCLRDLGSLAENELNSMDARATNIVILDNENRLHAILDNVLDGIITIDELGIVESFNKSAEQIFGYTASEVIGQNVKMLMPEPYHSQHDGYLHNYASTGNKKIIGIGRQVVGQRKDGSTFPMDLAVSEMQLGGKRMFTGIVRNITERVKVERMKSEFVSTVSHELRTPLTSIRGALALIAGEVVGELPMAAKPLVDIAHKNSERLILLVNDILDMEKIESGKMEFTLTPARLMPLLKQALDDNRAYAEQYKVGYELESELAMELSGAMISVDVNRMLQVLANLLSNATKFSPAGGKVSVAVERIGQHIRVAVKDNGPGISDEFKNRIFQKFAQADSSDTRKKGGTGLGLSITKAIVEQMGGSIGFDSQPNVQTTFYIEFPEWLDQQINQDQSLPNQMRAELGGARPRVLHVEDDPDVFHVVHGVAGEAVDMVQARNLAEARQMLVQNRYDLVILDLNLPDGSGKELLPLLKTALPPVPVLVFSVYEINREDVKQVDAVLVKSRTDNMQLLETIKRLTGIK